MSALPLDQPATFTAVDFDPFAGGDILLTAPATEPQKEIWASVRLGEDANCAYNESVSLRLRGPLDVTLLQQAVQQLVLRHEALRTTISPDGNNLCIHDTLDIPVVESDLSALSSAEQDSKMKSLLRQAVTTPFDLEHGPLFRAQVLQLQAQDYWVILTAHHIICDGWSWGVLIPDLGRLYSALTTGEAADLEDPDRLSEYALQLQAEAGSEEALATEAYWLRQFAGAVPVLDLPTDRPRPSFRTFVADRRDYTLDGTLMTSLKQLGTQLGCSFMSTILASFEVFLHRLTGQEDCVVGVPAAGQAGSGQYSLVGHCVNLLPIRSQIDGHQSFSDYLKRRKPDILDAYDNQQFTFGSLLQKLTLPRDPSRIPLVSVIFNLDQGLEGDRLPFAGLQAEVFSNPRAYENFELYVNVTEFKHKLVLEWQYNTNLFDEATIDRHAQEFETLLRSIVAHPDQQIGCLPLLPAPEQDLLAQWQQTETPYPNHLSIHQLVEAQAERTPAAVAAIFDHQQLTYQELNQRANHLAHHLRSLGVGPNVLVGICLERSLELVVGLLGILKAGGAYVPLDPTYPQERLALMLEDSQAPVLLTQQGLLTSLPPTQAQVLCLDTQWETIAQQSPANPTSQTQPEHLAYVIYTSGSTGKPKGVSLNHRLLVNLLHWQLQQSALSVGAKTVQFTPVSFDVSFQEIFSTWSAGGTLVLISEDTRKDAVELLRFLNEQEIERLFLPFIGLQHLAEVADSRGIAPASLREVITAGEQLQITRSIANWFSQLPDCTLYNHYGPSETHVVTSFTLPSHPKTWMPLPPIGRPIANTQVYLLNPQLQLVPIGVAGELCVAVDDAIRGYIHRPELTAEKFIPHPFSQQPGARLYKTGDLARYLPDGNIEFLGRIDNQVKVRGFRIELGELEAALSQHPAVRDAVAAIREDVPGDKRLVAYAVLNPTQEVPSSELRSFLKQKLPEYMLPTAFVLLEKMPLTPSGKVDRRSLPAPDTLRADLAASYVAPRNPVEEQTATVWAQILKLERVGIHDNFFELGGYSLLGTQVLARLRQLFSVDLPLRALFEAPTVAELADRVETLRWVTQSAPPPSDSAASNYDEGEL
ncbi:non-ribosomal peptide synthetase [Leptolyngbya sp. 'hensonii']|uniref:non-ribosomal peptide synthetase n=1 Tax=Leptolyngbya sp. 'hensonii' TaxID=1922337 RepID=UPI0009502048|nr:non-ribosomal peptide synthetase [Leptolyngbya sp. 'hensonii']OLP20470.1 non-ribosomal peptide synthetase [Leptolyngbya sp. 'hensonii']